MADWLLFDVDPLTQRKKYMKLEDGLLHIRETMPVDAVLEANKRDANDWQSNGGWKAARHGAVVARVPLILDNTWKNRTPAESHDLALASYNAGMGNILKAQKSCGDARLWNQIAPCLQQVTGAVNARETTGYVANIHRWHRALEMEKYP